MPDQTIRLEIDLDDAEARLRNLRMRMGEAKAAMMAAVEPFLAFYPRDLRAAERRRAHDSIEDLLTDAAWAEQTALENEITDAENALAPIEDADLRSNAPGL